MGQGKVNRSSFYYLLLIGIFFVLFFFNLVYICITFLIFGNPLSETRWKQMACDGYSRSTS